MNEDMVIQYLLDTFPGVEQLVAQDDSYFFYGSDHKFPIVTLVTGDRHDTVSNLDRPGVYRLNIGITKQTFRRLFGEYDAAADDAGIDFAALDRLMPHPVYGKMYWVSVLNPSDATFRSDVQPLLAEAYEQAVGKQARREARA